MLRALAAAIVSVCLGSAACAGTLGLSVLDDPEISAAGAASNIPGVLDFSFLASNGASTAPAMASNLDIALTAAFQPDGSLVPASGGGLNVGSASAGLFLGGVIIDAGFVIDPGGLDMIELLYGDLTGAAANDFGPQVLAVVTGEFGASVSDLFEGGFDAEARVVINPVATPIPIPASLPLLAAGLLLVGVVRRGKD